VYSEDDQVVLEYRLVSRGREDVWINTGGGSYELQNREIFLRHEPTRTTPRPLGYVLPPSMAKVLPVLLDHGLTVHRFTEPVQLELEVYDATEVLENEYFQGHYLKSVRVQKSTEIVEIPAGAYYVATAQSRSNLIAYMMEPETDDNLITWGWADHVLRVTGPPAADEDGAPAPQRVPMMRLVREQRLPVIEVVPFNDYDRNRYYQLW
jgi:hypothetical protein